MCGGEGELRCVRQVEIVDGDDEGAEALAGGQGLGEGFDKGGFADALNAVEADYEGAGRVGCAEVGFKAFEDCEGVLVGAGEAGELR